MHSSTHENLAPAKPVLLGPVERLFWRVENGFAGLFRVTIVMRLDGCIEADLLAGALHRLQCRHPKLRAVIVDGGVGQPCYQFDETGRSVPFEIEDYDDREFAWREAAQRLMQGALPAAGPLIAVTVLRSRTRGRSDLLLTAHHAVADGMSAIMLIGDLLAEYARGEAEPEVQPRPALPTVTAMRAKTSGGWAGRLWLLRRLRRMMREDRSGRQTSLPEVPGIPPQSQWVHWVFSRQDTLELVRRCRREQVSLGAALVAAVFCGLVDCLPGPQALLKCSFPFDLRDAVEGPAGPVTLQDLGCFVSIMNEFYEVRQPPAFWELARRAHQNHQTFVKQGGPSFYYNLAATAAFYDRLKAFARLMPRRANAEPPSDRRVTLLATHYGVLNLREAYGSLRPRACTLTFKNDTFGPSTVLEALVMGQRLNIGLGAGNLDPAFWAQLQMAVRKHLGAAIPSGESGFVEA